MNNYLYLKIKDYSSKKIIEKLSHINVSVFHMEKKDDYIVIKILEKDYDKIRKYLKTLEFKKIKYSGPKYLKETFKRYRYNFIAILIAFLFILFSSNIIVDIDVIHEDEKLVKTIIEELERYGIKKFSFKKSYNSLQKIKQDIKNRNLDKIDWLEINKVGMKYVVRIEERIINAEPIAKEYCHLYATKDSLVTKVKVFSGVSVVEINDYVKKGDLLVSGDIKLNEEIVDQVCASGNVYAEVWYNVNIKVPFKYYEIQKTGKTRKNIIINYDDVDHQLFKDRLEYYEAKKRLVFDLLGVKIYIKTDEEIIKKAKEYTEEETIQRAIELAKEKVSLKLKSADKIISQKILQKRIIDSTMDIDIFIVAEEEISSLVEARKEAENGL